MCSYLSVFIQYNWNTWIFSCTTHCYQGCIQEVSKNAFQINKCKQWKTRKEKKIKLELCCVTVLLTFEWIKRNYGFCVMHFIHCFHQKLRNIDFWHINACVNQSCCGLLESASKENCTWGRSVAIHIRLIRLRMTGICPIFFNDQSLWSHRQKISEVKLGQKW